MAVADVRRPRLARMLLAGAAFATVCGCSSPCGNTLVSTLPSPDGYFKAIVFTRDCGATVRTVTEVSVAPASAGVPYGWANALSVGDDPNHPIERIGAAIDVRLNWTSCCCLSVSFPRAAVTQKRVASVSGVVIDYGTF